MVYYLGEAVSKITVSILELPQETIFHREMAGEKKGRLVSELPYISGNTLLEWREDTSKKYRTNKITEQERKQLEMDRCLVEMTVKSCLRNIGIPIMG